MNAKEARERALKITSQKEREQHILINNRIEEAVDKGNLYINFYGSLMPAVKLQLEKDGYSISQFHDQRDGTTITIKW